MVEEISELGFVIRCASNGRLSSFALCLDLSFQIAFLRKSLANFSRLAHLHFKWKSIIYHFISSAIITISDGVCRLQREAQEMIDG